MTPPNEDPTNEDPTNEDSTSNTNEDANKSDGAGDPWTDRSKAPEWGLANVIPIDTAVGIYACIDEDDTVGGQTLVWHWCTRLNRYMAAGTGAHQLVSREPLHIEPSLLWNCCGQHGWIRGGKWVQA